MRRLVLIRHSVPLIDPAVPAAKWHLSPEGAARARQLARRVPCSAPKIFTSREPKARETAAAIAEVWRVPVEEVAGLEEHHRPSVSLLTRDEFDRNIRDLFENPTTLVFGTETAAAAHRRFSAAIMRVVTRTTDDVAVVTHGTVMTLFVSAATGVNAFDYWKAQQMPSATILSLPELTLVGTATL
jgi:broad specificity phosphatase PhoE